MKNTHSKTPQGFGHFLRKAMLLAVTGICLILGVIGLVLPIIPGVLFLFLGAWCLAKLSNRFANYFNQNPLARKWQNRSAASKHLSVGEKLKLSVLYGAKSVLDTMENVWQRLVRSGRQKA